jgi:signal transduction histidine kinase/FixJ family two-component response regulator
MNDRPDPDSLPSFRESDGAIRLRASKIGHALVLALVPAGATLDWLVYPNLMSELVAARLLLAGVAGVLLALHYTEWAHRNIRWFAMLVALLVNAVICGMVFRTEGIQSPYYAGLNLVLTGIGVILPWAVSEAVFVCLFTIAAYALACVAHGDAFQDIAALYNNLYFLTLTSLICITATYFNRRQRLKEFALGAALARSYHQVSELERLKSEFFANVSHELRTPLTLIVSPLQDVDKRRGELPKELGELVRLARDNSLRLLRIVSDLLELGRVESQELRLTPEPIELGDFVAQQIVSVRRLATLKHVVLELTPMSDRFWVTADAALIEKILINLLTNAIKFTPQLGKISVDVRHHANDVIVEVSDTGVGIAEGDLPYIFDRFRQVGGRGRQRLGGVGLGLALSKQLAEKHGGELRVRSRLGEGSAFSLLLPRSNPEDVADTECTRPVSTSRPADADDPVSGIFHEADRAITVDVGDAPLQRSISERGRILIIDDEPEVREYLVKILDNQYEIVTAADGEEGVSLARQVQPDIALVDLIMPGMDGYQVCRALKESSVSGVLKVMVLTARADEMARVAAFRSGADDVVCKPFSTLDVRTRVARLHRTFLVEHGLRLENRRLKRNLEERCSANSATLLPRP